MSRIGQKRIEMQESEDYIFGRESAERGEPRPVSALAGDCEFVERLACQQLGWDDYWNEQQSA